MCVLFPSLALVNGFRFDGAHPAVLAENTIVPTVLIFLGRGGAASLNQYFGMQQMLPQLENKQVVYVISPSVVQ